MDIPYLTSVFDIHSEQYKNSFIIEADDSVLQYVFKTYPHISQDRLKHLVQELDIKRNLIIPKSSLKEGYVTSLNGFRMQFSKHNIADLEILRSYNIGSNTIYVVDGILLQPEKQKLIERLQSTSSEKELRIVTFNVAFNVMANRLAGSEKPKVKECQARYNGGWSNASQTLSSCTKNSAHFLSQYDIFGLQEVNASYARALFDEIKLGGNFEFLISTYFGDWYNVIGYDASKVGHATLLTSKDYRFPKHAQTNDVRSFQAAWFPNIQTLFINVHAPHHIPLKVDLLESFEDVRRIVHDMNLPKPSKIVMTGDFNDDTGSLLKETLNVFGMSLKIPNGKNLLTCCTDSKYVLPGDYIFTTGDVIYYGLPQGYDRNKILMSDHDPVLLTLKLDTTTQKETFKLEGMKAQGIIKTSGSYVEIQFKLDQDILEHMAREYVKQKNLGWNVRRPYAWTDYDSMPHVTLSSDMSKYVGRTVDATFGKLYHFTDNGTRWIAVEANLPKPYRCEYECHMSIGQQRIK